MRTKRKSTRRWIARRRVYAEIRRYIKAELDQLAAKYGTNEYETARWQSHHFYGRALGAIDMAREVGALEYEGMSESYRLEKLVRRATDACGKRRDAILEEKRRLREERRS